MRRGRLRGRQLPQEGAEGVQAPREGVGTPDLEVLLDAIQDRRRGDGGGARTVLDDAHRVPVVGVDFRASRKSTSEMPAGTTAKDGRS